MRRGKACAPSWSDIDFDFDFDFDFDRATVTVDESVKAAEGGRVRADKSGSRPSDAVVALGPSPCLTARSWILRGLT